MTKKNRVSLGGKSFHITTSGKFLPLGKKQNAFTACMSALEGTQNKGINLSAEQLKQNKNNFGSKVNSCKGKGTSTSSLRKYARKGK